MTIEEDENKFEEWYISTYPERRLNRVDTHKNGMKESWLACCRILGKQKHPIIAKGDVGIGETGRLDI